MNIVFVLVKNNLKLLFRNKGFLFFLCAIPILSLLILNIKENGRDINTSSQTINELENNESKIVYLADMSYYIVKVYDSSGSKITDHLLNKLADTGLFTIYRYDSRNMTEDEILALAKDNAYNDRIGTILYFSPAFEKEVLAGKFEDSITMYRVSEDERWDQLKESFQLNLSVLLALGKHAKGGSEELTKQLDAVEDKMPEKKVVEISSSDNIALTGAQKVQKEHMGYSFAIMIFSFSFCGIFIAYTVIEERDNRVFIRITLSNASNGQYILSKLMVSVFVSIVQTIIIGIGIFLIVRPDFGISKVEYLFLIFLIGMIFNTLSLCVGVIVGNVMGANYAVFCIWSLSSLLSGSYFSIEKTSGMFKNISNFMPQKWFIQAAELFMTGDSSVYIRIVCITIAYLLVILSIGAAGLRLKHEE